MNARTLLWPLGLLLLAFLVVLPARGEGGFVISGADAIAYLDMSGSAPLNTRLAATSPRIVVEFANALHTYPIVPPPPALQSRLGSAADRMVVQYANAIRHHPLTYPTQLIGDSTPPLALNIEVGEMTENGAAITWSTSEFADSRILYGTSPTTLDQSVASALYVRDHRLTLSNLVEGVTYYYQVQSRDLSANLYTSPQYSFTLEASSDLFLPFISR